MPLRVDQGGTNVYKMDKKQDQPFFYFYYHSFDCSVFNGGQYVFRNI